MKEILLGGVSVKFPYDEPYPSQKLLMTQVIRAAEKGVNALLESPTGTGKTLSLLCGVLAWLNAPQSAAHKLDARPKIFLCTRTHSQIAQIIHELQRTPYSPVMTVLGSRDQLCVHPKVSKSSNKNEECSKLLADKKCPYYPYEKVSLSKKNSTDESESSNLILDIEDLVHLGKKKKVCPYFATRNMVDEAELIICPYNFLFDETILKGLRIGIDNAIVMVDEAHNIEDTARESLCFEASFGCLQKMRDSLVSLVEQNSTLGICRPEFQTLSDFLSKLCKALVPRLSCLTDEHVRKKLNTYTGFELKGFLESEIDLSLESCEYLRGALSKADDETDFNGPRLPSECRNHLDRLLLVMSKVLQDNNYKYFNMALPRNHLSRGLDDPWSFAIWCLYPGLGISHLNCARSIILTSGTLSPMDSFSSELGLTFTIKAEAPHVIDTSKQIMVGAVGEVSDYDGEFTATYRNTENPRFQDAIGRAIYNSAKVVPHGVLCFVPSYRFLSGLMTRWKSNGIFGNIASVKEVLLEPRQSHEMDGVIHRYCCAVEKSTKGDGKGPILFAIYRGKFSEGIDFPDNMARGVIVVGIPYPNITDTRVFLKKRFNDDNVGKDRMGLLPGTAWYELQAFRALNQAIGRCIRHQKDFGAIVLLDRRYTISKTIGSLSKWVRSLVHTSSLEHYLADIPGFFVKNLDGQGLADEKCMKYIQELLHGSGEAAGSIIAQSNIRTEFPKKRAAAASMPMGKCRPKRKLESVLERPPVMSIKCTTPYAAELCIGTPKCSGEGGNTLVTLSCFQCSSTEHTCDSCPLLSPMGEDSTK